MSEKIKQFNAYRTKMNDRILAAENTGIKRFFNLDTTAYQDGVLPARTKEMLGLCASVVLRCNDCITYHVLQCKQLGVSTKEFDEIMNISLVVGGSITIPHIRKAYEIWDEGE